MLLSCVCASDADEFIKAPTSSVDILLLDWQRRHKVTHGCLRAGRRHCRAAGLGSGSVAINITLALHVLLIYYTNSVTECPFTCTLFV